MNVITVTITIEGNKTPSKTSVDYEISIPVNTLILMPLHQRENLILDQEKQKALLCSTYFMY